MRVPPRGSPRSVRDVLIADIQSSEKRDEPIDDQELPVIALSWTKAPEPSRRRIEHDDFTTRPAQTSEGGPIEFAAAHGIDDDAHINALASADLERVENTAPRSVIAEEVRFEVDVHFGTVDRFQHRIDRFAASIEERDPMTGLKSQAFPGPVEGKRIGACSGLSLPRKAFWL